MVPIKIVEINCGLSASGFFAATGAIILLAHTIFGTARTVAIGKYTEVEAERRALGVVCT